MIGQNMIMEGAAPSTFEHNMFEKQGPVMSGGSDDHDMGSMGGADHGFMVSIPQGGEDMTMTFTVTEDMVGEWEIGCFSDGGSHYTQGMIGKLIVNP
jgi:plastocyanin